VSTFPHPHDLRGSASPRFAGQRLLLIFGCGLLALLIVAIVVGALLAPGPPEPVCPHGQQVCGKPPRPPKLAARLVNETELNSPQLGLRLEYPSELVQIVDRRADRVEFQLVPDRGDDLSLVLQSAPASSTSPSALVQSRLDELRNTVLGLASDKKPADAVLGPEVGYRSGVGGVYAGTADSPTGISDRVRVVVMAASDGESTLAVSVATTSRSETRRHDLLYLANHILNSLRFSSNIVASSGEHGGLANARHRGSRRLSFA
jgi:hypothetical protein